MKWTVQHPSVEELEAALPSSIGAMLHQQARKTPEDETFVFFDDDLTLSYDALYKHVRRVASGLSAIGNEPTAVVPPDPLTHVEGPGPLVLALRPGLVFHWSRSLRQSRQYPFALTNAPKSVR